MFFNDTATTEIYTLSLHGALPIWLRGGPCRHVADGPALDEEEATPGIRSPALRQRQHRLAVVHPRQRRAGDLDRKSTRLNSSHANISYAVFCLKKKVNEELLIKLY